MQISSFTSKCTWELKTRVVFQQEQFLCIFILKNNNERCCHTSLSIQHIWLLVKIIYEYLVFKKTLALHFFEQLEITFLLLDINNIWSIPCSSKVVFHLIIWKPLWQCSSSSDCREIVPLQPSGEVY